ncbi:MAG: adenylate/guanylate cyclase domain-containing protein [Chloroflexi bacterium]|nr:adenylate/guanylate cyclase domain-containing protein [Chloroflexota bacterium]
MEQQIRFCTASDGVSIAYATVGKGPPLVKAANWLNHLEFDWESPIWGHLMRGLAENRLLVRYDERGTGLSDRQVEDTSFERWVSDLGAVVDAAGLDRFALLGISQGGPVAIAYAIQNPERVSHLILYGTYARFPRLPKTPEEVEEAQALLILMRQGWGQDNPAYRHIFTNIFLPNGTAEQMRWFADVERKSASPEMAIKIMTEFARIDVTEIAPRISMPTLILHCRDDQACPFSAGRELAALVPGARFVPMEGSNHLFLEGDPAREVFLREVNAFLLEGQAATAAPSGLVTILFTDMEGSTALTQRLGDAGAQELLRAHNSIVRDALKAQDGAEIKHTGDGIMASFPTASKALACATAIQTAFAERNETAEEPINVRIGLNAGEPVAEDEDLFGTAVQLAARVCAHAEPGQVLASNVVRELSAGKGFLFSDQGDVVLRGFEDPVRLYEVRGA